MTIDDYLKDAIARLKKAGIENPRLDAEILVSEAIGIDRYKLVAFNEKLIPDEKIKIADDFIKRRLQFEPVAYILNKKEFYSLLYYINNDVLIPRPETELLVDLVLYYARMDGSVLDIGTGSGAIAIAVKYNRRDLDVYGIDVSVEAINIAHMNMESICGEDSITFIHSDLYDKCGDRKYDVIVSNPPYIGEEMEGALQKELSFEPRMALFSNDSGKEILKRIIIQSKDYLEETGVLILEIGDTMRDFILDFGREQNYTVSILNDYSGLPRVAVLKNNG